MSLSSLSRNLSTAEAVRLARLAGATVEIRRRHGELIMRHPLIAKPHVTSTRRKDAARKTLAYLRSIERARAASSDHGQGRADEL